MKLLYVVQRFGKEVAGGAEHACRQLALRMVDRGHHVEVLTSCATSYVDWADVYEPGESDDSGVTVHRLSVERPRSDQLFDHIHARAVIHAERPALHLQEEWMRLQGPFMRGIESFISDRAGNFDAVVFFTYMYYQTYSGLSAASGRVPTVLFPAAHEEPPLYLSMFDRMFPKAAAVGFFSEEEAELIFSRFGVPRISAVVGLGTDLEVRADGNLFREQFGVTGPYLLFLGRVDPAKGSEELFEFFSAYKERNPGSLRLVYAGEIVRQLPSHDDVIMAGFLPDEVVRSAVAGSVCLVHPSYFESFSLVLVESWVLGTPVLVQGHCRVLEGQVRRSGGGIAYRGFEEFEAAIGMLLESADLREGLAIKGREYAAGRYSWDRVLSRYEDLLERTLAAV